MIDLSKKETRDKVEPIVLTDSSFAGFTKSNKLVLVDCWAAWCGPCMMLSPIVDQLAAKYSGKITFGKLNVDENPSTSSQFGIMSIPTLLVFNNGQLVDRIVGASPLQVLKQKLDGYLAKYS